ncbi:MAG: hypothetical protein GY739_05155 [Mesoflavibacter sp.]|nr:hypothetical protein [Mesoflavibacter sp.]
MSIHETQSKTEYNICLKCVSMEAGTEKIIGSHIVKKVFINDDDFNKWFDKKTAQGYKITGIHKS